MSCSCAGNGSGSFEDQVEAALAEATFVFLGEVDSLETVTQSHTMASGRMVSSDVQVARIKVLKIWKGSGKTGDILLAQTTTTCCLCGLAVKAKQQLLVYTRGVEPIELSVCSRTTSAGSHSPAIPVIERILRGEPARGISIEVPEPNKTMEPTR
jgi:hypothetical protein